MSVSSEEEIATEGVHIPTDIDWKMLDKSKFFLLGSALFSGVSATLYPIVVLKTRQQVVQSHSSCIKMAISQIKHEGFRSLYRGFATSLTGTIPARALYMAALEVTKSNVGTLTINLGFPESTASIIANATAGLSAAMAAQVVWTPIDVVTQRLMIHGSATKNTNKNTKNTISDTKYLGGIDAFRKIIRKDGIRGLYRGFGLSILTYAPSNAVWWGSYSVSQRVLWSLFKNEEEIVRPGSGMVTAVQGVSAAMAGGVSAVITMPLDTIKTRVQVLDFEKKKMSGYCNSYSIGYTVKVMVREGGWLACYRGLGPRWASMAVSATTMITTYEFLKRLSAKDGGIFT